MESAAQVLRRIVSEQFGVAESELSDGTRFVEDLGADSLDLVELLIAFEEELGRSISDDNAARITTVGNAIAYLSDDGTTGSPARLRPPPKPLDDHAEPE